MNKKTIVSSLLILGFGYTVIDGVFCFVNPIVAKCLVGTARIVRPELESEVFLDGKK